MNLNGPVVYIDSHRRSMNRAVDYLSNYFILYPYLNPEESLETIQSSSCSVVIAKYNIKPVTGYEFLLKVE